MHCEWWIKGKTAIVPFAGLLYLRIAYCSIKKVELHAKNLKTFVYHGVQLPIDLGEVKKLETAELYLYGITFEYVLGVLPSVLPGVQNFTLQTNYLPLEVCCCNILWIFNSIFSFDLTVFYLPDALITGKHWQIFPAEIFTAVTPSKLWWKR